MDRQYQYVFIGDSDHHGFLSHDPVEYADPISEEGVRRFQIEAEFRKFLGVKDDDEP